MSTTEDVLRREFPIQTAYTGNVSWWLGWFLVLGLGLVPVYFFPSGGFQIADPIIAALIMMAYFVKDVNEHVKRHIYLLLPYVIWTVIVNSGYFIVYKSNVSVRLMVTSVYDFFIMWCFTCIYFEVLKKKGVIFIYMGILLALVAIFAVPGQADIELSPRFSYSFNNPNQLALYCLFLYATVLLLMQYRIDHDIKNKVYIVFDVIILLTIQYLSWQAVSRAGLAASLVLHIALIRKIFSKRLFVPVTLAVTVITTFIVFYNPTFIQDRLAARNPQRLAKEAIWVRIESAIIKPMENLTGLKVLVGTGSVIVPDKKHPMVKGFDPYRIEVHNMFGHALWVYGLIGFFLFVPWIAKSIWETRLLKDGLFVWGAILAFSFAGVVIRARSFWILLGLMMALLSLRLFEQDKVPKPSGGYSLRR